MASGAPTFPSACAVPLDHDENATPRASATGRTKARAAGRATGRAVAVFAAIAMLAVVTIVVVVVVVVMGGGSCRAEVSDGARPEGPAPSNLDQSSGLSTRRALPSPPSVRRRSRGRARPAGARQGGRRRR